MSEQNRTRRLVIVLGLVGLVVGLTLGMVAGHLSIGPGRAGEQVIAQARSLAPSGQPQSFADLADRCEPTVVSVGFMVKAGEEETARRPRRGFPFGPPPDMPEEFRRFFREFSEPQAQEEEPGPKPPVDPKVFEGTETFVPVGSGVVIDAKAGYILTNHHVTVPLKDKKFTVMLSSDQRLPAEVVGSDSETDIALLRFRPKSPVQEARLGDSDRVRVGDWVMAIGNPFGMEHTVTVGVLSARGRRIGVGTYDNFLQTDAAINPGNSGGPLFNMAGEVIGINTAINAAGQGIGFAVPSNAVKEVVAQIKAHGKVTRGYIGVSLLDPARESQKRGDVKEGAWVAGVQPGSVADKAGIKVGDIIIRFGDQRIRDANELIRVVARAEIGKSVPLELIRAGKTQRASIAVAERPPKERLEQ